MLYAQWKHQGVKPWKAWTGVEQAPWPYLASCVEMAFAIHAASVEATTRDILDAFSGGSGNSE